VNGALVISWGTSVRGRETKSLEVFGKALTQLEAFAKQGRIHGHKEYFALTGNVSEMAGLQVVDGEVEELQRILIDDDFLAILGEAEMIVDNFTVRVMRGGSDEEVQHTVGQFVEAIQKFGT